MVDRRREEEEDGSDMSESCLMASNCKSLVSKNLSSQGSLYMAGCIQEGFKVYKGLMDMVIKSQPDSNPFASRKRNFVQGVSTMVSRDVNSTCIRFEMNFSNSVTQIKTVLDTWLDLLRRAVVESQYLLRLEILQWSHTLLKFILKVRNKFLEYIEESSEELTAIQNRNISMKICYLETLHVNMITRLFCETINQARSYPNGEHVHLIMHLFLDVLEIFMEGALQSVQLDMEIIQDWFFIVSLPWLKDLDNMLPCCTSVPMLNTIFEDGRLTFDVQLRQRCLLFLRFEGFFLFRDCVTEILKLEMLKGANSTSCKSILYLISGLWWPIEQFEWKELLQYCQCVISWNIWMENEEVAIVLAEAIVRLPCIYCHEVVIKLNQQSLNRPVPRGCPICDVVRTPAIQGLKLEKKLANVKMQEEDCKLVRLLMYKMLRLRKETVQLRLITILLRLRKHSDMNLASFTSMFWKIFSRTSSSAQIKVVDMYGFCTGEKLKLHRTNFCEDLKNRLENKGKKTGINNNVSFNKSHTPSASNSKTDQRKTSSHVKRKGLDSGSNSLDPKRRKLDSFDDGTNGQKNKVQKISPVGRSIAELKTDQNTQEVLTFYSKNIHSHNMNSEFLYKPPSGRFDAVAFLYCKYLYQFHLDYKRNVVNVGKTWNSLTRHYTVFKNLIKYVDANVWMVEFLKCHLHLLSRLKMTQAISMCSKNFLLLARRAGCTVPELFGRFREILGQEIKNLCLDIFCRTDPTLTDRENRKVCVKKCLEFFERIRLAIDWSRLHMEKNLLRCIITQSVPDLFGPNRSKVRLVISAVAEYGSRSTPTTLLELEFPYYYTNLVLNSPMSIEKLLPQLERRYNVQPNVVAENHEQLLHITLLSHLFEQQEKVLQQYSTLLTWLGRNTPKSSLQSFESSIPLFYIGVLIYFEGKFSSKFESFYTKRKYLANWAMLLCLLGKKLVTVSRIKIYSTLNSLRALGPQFHDLLLVAWKSFTNNLEDEALGQMANQIFSGMMYLQQTNEEKVIAFFKNILRNRSHIFKRNIKKLHFLHYATSDKDIKKAMEPTVTALCKPDPTDFFYQLVDEIGHENSHVRYMAVKKMKRVLQEYIMRLDVFKFEEPLFPHCLTKLLRCLLSASKKSTDNEMKILCATCIGYIGSLNPSRFDLKEQLSDNARFGLSIFTVGQTDFNIFILEELASALQGSVDTCNFDACAYCIQEIIKLYDISQAMNDGVWSRLSSQTKDLISPLFTSRFSKSDESEQKEEYSIPIYMSSAGGEFRKWIYHWSDHMVSYIRGETRCFFDVMLLIIKQSEQMGLLLLPYVASYAIMDGPNEVRQSVLTEINAVIGYWVREQSMFVDSNILTPGQLGGEQDKELDSWNELLHHQQREEETKERRRFPYAATQAVFKVLDHLTRLVRNPKLDKKKSSCSFSESSQAPSQAEVSNRHHTKVAAEPVGVILDKLRYDILSKAAFGCLNFARSLMYMEQHLDKNRTDFRNCIGNLQRIYVALYDDDALRGLEVLRGPECSVMEEALTNLSRDKLKECLPSFELLVAQDPDNLVNYQQLIYAHLGLNHVDASDLLINGCIAQSPEWSKCFEQAKIEICVKQKNFAELARQVERQSNEKLSWWGVAMGKAVLSYNEGNVVEIQEAIDTARTTLISDICSRTAVLDMGFYYKHYKDLVRFQLLSEMEETLNILRKKSSSYSIEDREQHLRFLVNNWNRRLKCVYKSTTIFYPIVNFRRTLIDLTKKHFLQEDKTHKILNIGLRDSYIQLAKIESGLGNYDRGLELLTESKKQSSSSVCYDEAKLLLAAGKMEQCMQVLKMGTQFMDLSITRKYRASKTNISTEQMHFSKAALLYAKQMDIQQLVDSTAANSHNYKFAIDMNCRSEKNYFHAACYFDRVWSQSIDREKSDLPTDMIKFYCDSLQFGCKYIYQSLTRLLTIWFDYSVEISDGETSKAKSTCDPKTVQTMTNCIKSLVANAPTYIFMLVFSQLISRMCHNNLVVWGQLRDMLAHIVITHVDQVLWMIINVLQSTYRKRVTRCSEILKIVSKKKAELRNVVRSYKTLADKLISFTIKNPNQSRYLRVIDLCPDLPRFINSPDFKSVLVPFQEFMRPMLPRSGEFNSVYNAFPTTLVHIRTILEPVHVMSSLQRPKRITFLGTNGKKYAILCKPSDDLRKDGKVMEVNNMVQFYLSRKKESKKRNLIVRTYHVVPLSDNCGLLEWIRNLHGYKALITSLYKDGVGNAKDYKNARTNQCHRQDPFLKKLNLFNELMGNHPVIMSHWFLKAFEDPQSWYKARSSYVKTTAVMSITGFLMGLGDRHGENILVDSSNGESVHVDFNCLFNKGETFDWPERVPFRLTKNMINAMGPLGYEGTYRRCSEITMRLARDNSSVFLSIIRSFVHDPLLEWELNVSIATKDSIKGEVVSSKANDVVNCALDRLLGVSRTMVKERSVPLSVEAHVNYLIEEATKTENLCQMYVGWAAFL